MVHVTGVLTSPIGMPIAHATIRATALNTTAEVMEGSKVEIETPITGAYSLELANALIAFEINYKDKYYLLGHVLVDDSYPATMTLPEILQRGVVAPLPHIDTGTPDWAHLFEDARLQDSQRDIQQARQGANYSSHQEVAYEGNGSSLTVSSLETKAGDTETNRYGQSYSDENLNEAYALTESANTREIQHSSKVEGFTNSSGKSHTTASEVTSTPEGSISTSSSIDETKATKEQELLHAGGVIKDSLVLGSSEIEDSRVITGDFISHVDGVYGAASYEDSETFQQVANPLAQDKRSLSLEKLIGGLEHSAKYEQSGQLRVDSTNTLEATAKNLVRAYAKEAGTKTIIKDGQSSTEIKADKLVVQGDAPLPLLELNTQSQHMKLRGSLEIENAQDFIGPAGKTYDFIYQYSSDNGNTDPWHDDYRPEHFDSWRRQQKTVDGVPEGTWSDGFYLNAKDGRDGDKYWSQYEYSTDDTTKALDDWHVTYVTGDDWRRYRVIENGSPVPVGHPQYGPVDGWHVERMKGSDGPPGWVAHLEYGYSVDGDEPWSPDFNPGDHYRREKVDWYASNEEFSRKDDPVNPSEPIFYGSWSAGKQIVPVEGIDYGDKYHVVKLYTRMDVEDGDTTTRPVPPSEVEFNFTTLQIDRKANTIWHPEIPVGTEDIWVAFGTAHSLNETDLIDDWVVERETIGGYKTAVVWLYRLTPIETLNQGTGEYEATPDLLESDLPQNPLEYTFALGEITSTPVGGLYEDWSPTIPTPPTDRDGQLGNAYKLWVTQATAVAKVSQITDTIEPDDWETPMILSSDGVKGANGEDGNDGIAGTSGSGWYYVKQLPSSYFASDTSFKWSTYGGHSGTATKHIADYVEDLVGDRKPRHGDVVMVESVLIVGTPSYTKVDTGIWDSALNRFEEVTQLISGSLVVDGTIAARHIKGDTITANEIYSEIVFGKEATFSGALTVGGGTGEGSFNVNKSGEVTISPAGGGSSDGLHITSTAVTVMQGGYEVVKLGVLT